MARQDTLEADVGIICFMGGYKILGSFGKTNMPHTCRGGNGRLKAEHGLLTCVIWAGAEGFQPP